MVDLVCGDVRNLMFHVEHFELSAIKSTGNKGFNTSVGKIW
jgi:hypothetical protein